MQISNKPAFFQKPDWASFGITSLLSFAVYLATLAPENDLNFSGIFATSAMYLGVPNPPAYPLWTVYSALFVKLLPFLNIAWRVGLATATASALTCGLIALTVSRTGFLAVEYVSGFANLTAKEQAAFRIVCGGVAGMGFGLDGCFWRKAVIPDQWNFNICLFALVLSLLTRWFFTPEQKRDLYLAALTEGLLLSDSQALLPTALALPFLVALGNPALGREIFFLLAALFCFALAINAQLHLFESFMNGATRIRDVTATALAALFWIVLLVKTRQFFSEWITSISCVTLFLAGISAYFLLPAFSMANPPVNWGYPRTVEGFFHVLSRGQYGQAEVATKLSDLLRQWFIYGNIAVDEFGAVYLAAAAIPLLFLRKMAPLNRKWFLGLFIVWLLVSELMLIHLNISWDNSTYELNETFFSATHFVLAILAGCGFMLAGAYYARSSKRKPRPLRGQC